jgi:L-amino acid N-acyltransferase YncA
VERFARKLRFGNFVELMNMIRQATTEDAPQICAIYNHYVLKTLITFEEQPVTHDEMVQPKENSSWTW